MDYLKMNEMKEGYTYHIHARNATIGIWFSKHKSFTISRHKFGNNYIFEEYHWETGAPHGTVKPIEEIEKSLFTPNKDLTRKLVKNKDGEEYMGISKEEEILDYLNKISENYISVSELINRIRIKEYKCGSGKLSEDKDWYRLIKSIIASDLYFKLAEKIDK